MAAAKSCSLIKVPYQATERSVSLTTRTVVSQRLSSRIHHLYRRCQIWLLHGKWPGSNWMPNISTIDPDPASSSSSQPLPQKSGSSAGRLCLEEHAVLRGSEQETALAGLDSMARRPIPRG